MNLTPSCGKIFYIFFKRAFVTLSAGIDYKHNWHIEAIVHCLDACHKGGRLATSVGGILTGRSGSIIILDDPQKPQEAMSDTARQKLKN